MKIQFLSWERHQRGMVTVENVLYFHATTDMLFVFIHNEMHRKFQAGLRSLGVISVEVARRSQPRQPRARPWPPEQRPPPRVRSQQEPQQVPRHARQLRQAARRQLCAPQAGHIRLASRARSELFEQPRARCACSSIECVR